MCGVIASVGTGSADVVERGLKSMSYRGIRSRIVDLGRAGAMGHVRLPIVGVGEDNDQPVRVYPWTIGFVGEVFGFRELRPDLDCDLGLVVDRWTERGPGGFIDLDGFWSVVAWDSRTERLHCLVDYLSQKPLYVRTDGSRSTVASELRPLVAGSLSRPDLDRIYLSACVKWGYCPEAWRTPYVGIRRMLPGEYAVLSESGIERLEVVDPLSPRSGDVAELVEEATRVRVLSSDVPVAALVSGGLDSAIVYTLASRYGNVRAYHVENGEKDAYRQVCRGGVVVAMEGVSVNRALDYHQEPVDLGSLIPQVAISDAVASAGGERVCLTGDGADECFGGYARASRYDSQASDLFHELVAWHLLRLDRVMMRNRIEVRSPFLARRVVEAAMALPREQRIDKRVLRDSFRNMLPEGVADVPKRALRTSIVEGGREEWSRVLVEKFAKSHEEGR